MGNNSKKSLLGTNRRDFLKTAAGLGIAALAMPGIPKISNAEAASIKDKVLSPHLNSYVGHNTEMTIVEKILARASGKNGVAAGETVIAKPDLAFIPDGLPSENEKAIQFGLVDGLPKVWDPEKLVIVLDHGNPYLTYQDAVKYKKIRELVKKFGIKYFYGINHGIGHTIMTEYGHVRPGEFILGRDSHTTYYGALNAGGIPVGISEITYVLLAGNFGSVFLKQLRSKSPGSYQTLYCQKIFFFTSLENMDPMSPYTNQ